jgi:hypothetical protein
MPGRIITAYWLIALGYLKFIGWGFLLWFFFDDSRNSLAESGGLIFLGTILAALYLVIMVLAGQWMRSAEPRGHYLALVALSLPVIFALQSGINGDVVLSLGFLVLIVADVRQLRSNPEFSLTVDSFRLRDFWPVPWLVTALCIALVGNGMGAVPAVLVHLLSPVAVGYIVVRLRSHPSIVRTPGPDRFFWSLAVWVLFYAASILVGIKFLEGLSGLAMQGAGN